MKIWILKRKEKEKEKEWDESKYMFKLIFQFAYTDKEIG